MQSLNVGLSAIGVLMGAFYVAASWRGKIAPNGALKDDPRVTGLRWGLFAAVIVLISNWQIALGAKFSEAERFELVGGYILAFLTGAIISLTCLIVLVWAESKRINGLYKNIYTENAINPLSHFCFYGYKDYKDNLRRCIDKRTINPEQRFNNLVEIEKSTFLANSQIIKAAVDIHIAYYNGRVSSSDACRHILRSIPDIVQSRLDVNLDSINASYMVVEQASKLDSNKFGTVKFLFEECAASHDVYLCLRGYARGGPPIFRLGAHTSAEAWQEYGLPGAPEAFAYRRAVVMDVARPKFGSRVPKAVKTQQAEYFKTQQFAAIVSIPLRSSVPRNELVDVVGILNIDFLLHDNKSFASLLNASIIEKAILPHCALLADIIDKELHQ